MEKSLQNAVARLKAVIDTAIDGIIVIDSTGVIESFNPAAAGMFGYTPEEVVGKNISMLMPQPHRRQHDGYLERYHATQKPRIIGIGREVPGLRKDGSVFPFRLAVSEMEFESGEKLFTGIVHDLSKQKEADERLRRYSEELEAEVNKRTLELAQANERLRATLDKEKELNDLKSRFVSMASHEFRTPLSTIMSSVTLIGRYEDPIYLEKRNKHISRIKAGVRNLTSILNDFLSLEKLERGKIQFIPTDFEFVPFIKQVGEEMQDVAKEGQQIQVRHTGDENSITADQTLLKNVLHNLLSNAIKYSGNDALIELNTEHREGAFHIEVRDHGIGIPEEEQSHLFERFFRAHNVSNIQGTGLGLSIVKEYVELMSGEISFSSKMNEGTSIKLVFQQKN
ncbi:MAG: PAS domain S-box protein [Bacteroidia bacterium]